MRFEAMKSSTDLQLHDSEFQNSRSLMLKDFMDTIRAVCGYDNNMSHYCSVRADRLHYDINSTTLKTQTLTLAVLKARKITALHLHLCSWACDDQKVINTMSKKT